MAFLRKWFKSGGGSICLAGDKSKRSSTSTVNVITSFRRYLGSVTALSGEVDMLQQSLPAFPCPCFPPSIHPSSAIGLASSCHFCSPERQLLCLLSPHPCRLQSRHRHGQLTMRNLRCTHCPHLSRQCFIVTIQVSLLPS